MGESPFGDVLLQQLEVALPEIGDDLSEDISTPIPFPPHGGETHLATREAADRNNHLSLFGVSRELSCGLRRVCRGVGVGVGVSMGQTRGQLKSFWPRCSAKTSAHVEVFPGTGNLLSSTLDGYLQYHPPPPHAEMSPAKTADAAVTSPKPRKSGGKPDNAAPAKSPPPSKTANHGPATPATAKRKRHRHRGPRNKNKARKDVEPAEDAGDEAAVAAKKKASLERKPKESSKDALAPQPNWKLSPALGGRFLQLDPVFARNEKYGICNPPDLGD